MTPAGKRLRRLVVTNAVEDSVHLSLLVDEVEAEAIAAERARIRAGVEGLRSHEPADDNEGDYVLRAAVLALFDGEKTPSLPPADPDLIDTGSVVIHVRLARFWWARPSFWWYLLNHRGDDR